MKRSDEDLPDGNDTKKAKMEEEEGKETENAQTEEEGTSEE